MKGLESSDKNTRVLSTNMNNATVRRAAPVSTAAIWGTHVFAGANSAIWGMAVIGGTNTSRSCSAIWGACPVWGTVATGIETIPIHERNLK